MILLTPPYSYLERQIDRERRRQASARAVATILYCAGAIILGVAFGMLIRG